MNKLREAISKAFGNECPNTKEKDTNCNDLENCDYCSAMSDLLTLEIQGDKTVMEQLRKSNEAQELGIVPFEINLNGKDSKTLFDRCFEQFRTLRFSDHEAIEELKSCIVKSMWVLKDEFESELEDAIETNLKKINEVYSKFKNPEPAENFRNRVDELVLLKTQINEQTFKENLESHGINYEDFTNRRLDKIALQSSKFVTKPEEENE